MVFQGRELQDLLIEALRYGDLPEVRGKLHWVVIGNITLRCA
jgi:hypothetical protein